MTSPREVEFEFRTLPGGALILGHTSINRGVVATCRKPEEGHR